MAKYEYAVNDVPWTRESDVLEMQKSLETIDRSVLPLDLYKAWEAYSTSMAAGWVRVPDDPNQIWDCISPYMRAV